MDIFLFQSAPSKSRSNHIRPTPTPGSTCKVRSIWKPWRTAQNKQFLHQRCVSPRVKRCALTWSWMMNTHHSNTNMVYFFCILCVMEVAKIFWGWKPRGSRRQDVSKTNARTAKARFFDVKLATDDMYIFDHIHIWTSIFVVYYSWYV